MHTKVFATLAGLLIAASSSAFAQTAFPEIEANSGKSEATPANCLVAGDFLTGTSTGTSTTLGSALVTTADYFRVTTCALPCAIYRHTLTLSSTTPGQTGEIRGLNQVGGTICTVGGTPGVTDTLIQTSTGGVTSWYGFGKAEQLYYKVRGTAATTAPYNSTLATTSVTPIGIGCYKTGPITITTQAQGHNTDTELWLYDGMLNAIPGMGNDDTCPAAGNLQSTLNATLAPGTYYMAITNFAFGINLPSPATDNFVTGALLDFPDIATNNSVTASLNVSFAITDSRGTTAWPATKVAAHDVVWFVFHVIPVPSPFATYCTGDVTSASACCPCNNQSTRLGNGCANSTGVGGELTATGATCPGPETVCLTVTKVPPTALTIFLQGNVCLGPVPFGAGLRCVGGNLKRLYTKNAVAGTVSAGACVLGDPPITVQSAALGDPIPVTCPTINNGPGLRFYQAYYRDPAGLCAGQTFNVTNGVVIQW